MGFAELNKMTVVTSGQLGGRDIHRVVKAAGDLKYERASFEYEMEHRAGGIEYLVKIGTTVAFRTASYDDALDFYQKL